ncbi:DUF159-domain-containing protein [Xylaria sp. CBS 124048]|nr:DUF159-domain-containing protein [Xylaria sp. CBS 124048]
MCGRYALALRPSQIRQMLRDDNMPVDEAPDDDSDDDSGGHNGPRQSYNFAPGYYGVVYRADVPDRGAGPRSRRYEQTSSEDADDAPSSARSEKDVKEQDERTDQTQTSPDDENVHYKLQAMKWGLIPFWTKRNPGYGSLMKTINCRDDSLARGGGLWSAMKGRKRCVVIAQGFYEWLKKDGGREKIPHFVKRKDGKLMCLAGLWDVATYENDEQKHYTYTIITTDSNKQLNFLHDRMPVILENGSENMEKWLDPKRYEWSNELQSLLKPYDGELEVYPVSKDVGKVGNNSPAFIIPIDSKENKSNISHFFAKGKAKADKKDGREEVGAMGEIKRERQPEIRVGKEEGFVVDDKECNIKEEDEEKKEVEPKDSNILAGIKREADDDMSTGRELRKRRVGAASNKSPDVDTKKASSSREGGGRQKKIGAMKKPSGSKSPTKTSKSIGTPKISTFFANSS